MKNLRLFRGKETIFTLNLIIAINKNTFLLGSKHYTAREITITTVVAAFRLQTNDKITVLW